MPGGMKTNGTDELSAMLGKLEAEAGNIAAQAMFEGAGVVADEYTKAVNGIQAKRMKFPFPEGKLRLPTPEEKAALVGSIGIKQFSKNGSEVFTVIGPAEGYRDVNGKQKAIKLIANAINSGTSFMKKQPIFRKAASASRKPAQEKMEKTAEKLIDKITK